MLEADIEKFPWSEQFRLDDVLYRKQIEYLLAHSRFYQAKLERAGLGNAGARSVVSTR